MSGGPYFEKEKDPIHRLPAGQKRRVEISIERHIGKNAYLLIATLPKNGSETVVISESQAKSMAETFKMKIINVR